MKKLTTSLLIVLCAAVFIYCGWQLGDYWLEYKHAKDFISSLSDRVVTEISDAPLENAPVSVDFDTLLSECPDIVGWLWCEGTDINYPVVRAEDNSYYLHRLTDGSYSANGTLFLDYRNGGDISDKVSVIYGHHMKTGAMFGKLDNYKEQEYYDEHPVMYLLTPEGSYKLELCAGINTDADADIYDPYLSDGKRLTLVLAAIEDSYFNADLDISSEDRFVILSTCDYDYYNSRFIVIAKLVPCA